MIKIYCKKCGAYLASHNASSVTYKGTVMPTENIDGIILIILGKIQNKNKKIQHLALLLLDTTKYTVLQTSLKFSFLT
jgi:hypothetical protein